MENRKLVKILIPILVLGLFTANSRIAFAYDIETHAYLTNEIFKFYNKHFPNQPILDELKNYLIDGARREDDSPRWMNHFYDPVYNRGLTYDPAIDSENYGNWEKSKDWAQNESNQNGLAYKVPATIASILTAIEEKKISAISSETDFTWQQAIRYYANGEKEKALFVLGHIIHLIEDASVPDHTRNDPHPEGSPYESFAAQFTLSNPDNALVQRLQNKQTIILNDLNSYFDELAKYSNNNFYSKDTIGVQSGYNLPDSIDLHQDRNLWFRFYNDSEFGIYHLVQEIRPTRFNYLVSSKANFSLVDDYNLVMSDYWSLLSTKAVQYGVGIINLFFQEAEKAKNSPQLIKSENKSFLASAVDNTVSTFQSAANIINQTAQNAISLISTPFKDFFTNRQLENSQSPENPMPRNELALPPSQPLSQNNQSLSQGKAPAETGNESREPSSISPNTGSPANNPNNPNPENFKNSPSGNKATTPDLFSANKNAENEENKNTNSPSPVVFAGGGGGVSAVSNPSSGNQNSGTDTSQNQSSSTTENSSSTQNNSSPENSSSTSSNSSSTASNSSSTSSTSNSTSTSSSTSSSSTSSSTPLFVSHILISEVLFDAAGSDEGKEFVELHNPATSSKDLAGWSLKYLEQGATSTTYLASFKASSHPEDKTIIPGQGFLLIGLNSYDSLNYNKAADIIRTGFLPNGGLKIDLILYDESNSDIDRLTYSSSSIAAAGNSLERKALPSEACLSAQNNGEFWGNGCDNNQDSDFEIRISPNPQNSDNLPEPRSAPSINNFQIVYNFAPRFDFSWDLAADSSGSTSTLSYFVYDISGSTSTLIFSATSTVSTSSPQTIPTSTIYSVNEVGRNYNFQFKAQDRDGLTSIATSTIAAKSFLDNFYFYRDARTGANGYLFDLATTSSRPFWNKNDVSSNQNWKGIVFYLNKDAPKENILSTENSLIPSDAAFGRVKYSTCAGSETSEPELLLPFNNYSCQAGGLMSGSHLFSELEDNRFAVKLASSSSDISFSSSTDYVTLAFYDFGGGGGGSQRLHLAAVDKTKYYFKDLPQNQNAPTRPGNFSVSFSTSTGRLNLAWSSSTDADTLDFLINYQINYSTSSLLSDSAWQSLGQAVFSASLIPIFPNSYKVGVRAADNFNNTSTAAVVDWSFPAGYVSLPSQLNHPDFIGTNSYGYGQKILINSSTSLTAGSTTTISAVALWAGYDSGLHNYGRSYLEIRRDNSNSVGELLATSDLRTIYDSYQDELIYAFPSPVSLTASSSYWLVPVQDSGTNDTRFFGTLADSYPDGRWSGNWGGDTYFRLIQ